MRSNSVRLKLQFSDLFKTFEEIFKWHAFDQKFISLWDENLCRIMQKRPLNNSWYNSRRMGLCEKLTDDHCWKPLIVMIETLSYCMLSYCWRLYLTHTQTCQTNKQMSRQTDCGYLVHKSSYPTVRQISVRLVISARLFHRLCCDGK